MPGRCGKPFRQRSPEQLFFEFFLHAFYEVLGPSGWGNHSVSHGLAQLVLCGTGILRDREVLGESVGAVDRYGAGHPDQFAGFDIENFGKLIIKNLVARLHQDSLRSIGILNL